MNTNQLSNRVNALAESETLAMTRKSRELKAQGHDVINLSIGEPDFNTPSFIKESAKKALDQNYTHYSPVSGFQELREAICHKLNRDNQLEYKPEQIVVSTGAKQSLANAMLALLNPGDEVIIPIPYWVSYKELVKLSEAISVFIPTNIESDFKITPIQLEKAITPKSKVFIFSSPCNPSGSVYSREELHGLARVLEKHPQIFIISDEIYEHINFTGKHTSIAQFDFIKDRVVLVNGVSKGFAMTGWRLGYMAADTLLAKACDKLQGQVTSGTSSVSQRATIDAMLVNPAQCEELKTMLSAFEQRRDLLLGLLKNIPGLRTNEPKGAFYVFPDVSYYFGKSDGENKITDCDELCDYLLTKAHVALVPGSAFGNPACIRISYAASEATLIKAIDRIALALNILK
ncbi:MAG: pyridoxal phosphate-dependent aminotransferase [Bacteroidales bacterium]|nr:pyridoxal phosphate-dependent aminotransferase [Bacteroidales bacterium]MDZ4203561.1 pyridoxal phosphate-dependent aminotransferase [Bacteroidales bacterium]